MDDDLMTKVFFGDNKTTEFLLRILMNNDELKVLKSQSQVELRNLFGHSLKLDILAEDSNKRLINIEIQPKRARYHAAMMDSLDSVKKLADKLKVSVNA